MNLIKTLWEVSIYEVWGNPTAGYAINDCFKVKNDFSDTWELKLRPEAYQTWAGGEQVTGWKASPSDTQIRQLLNWPRTKIFVMGDDTHLFVNRARDSYPMGELVCVSHASLSPIFSMEQYLAEEAAQGLKIS